MLPTFSLEGSTPRCSFNVPGKFSTPMTNDETHNFRVVHLVRTGHPGTQVVSFQEEGNVFNAKEI